MSDTPTSSMTAGIEIVPLYRSEPGDVWTLIHHLKSGYVVIRHVPNVASGGISTDTPVADFLATGRAGPEHQAVRRWVERAGIAVGGGF